MIRRSFTDEQVDAAIHLVMESAKDRGQTVSYTRVFEAGGLPAPQVLHQGSESQLVTQFMKAFHDRCVSRGMPPLDSLVVHVAGPREGKPGAGYFKVNGYHDAFSERTSPERMVEAWKFWEQQVAECKRWGIAARRAGDVS